MRVLATGKYHPTILAGGEVAITTPGRQYLLESIYRPVTLSYEAWFSFFLGRLDSKKIGSQTKDDLQKCAVISSLGHDYKLASFPLAVTSIHLAVEEAPGSSGGTSHWSNYKLDRPLDNDLNGPPNNYPRGPHHKCSPPDQLSRVLGGHRTRNWIYKNRGT